MKPFVSALSLVILSTVISSVFVEASSKPNNGKAIVCYVASWAYYRKDNGKFDTKDLQPELCTHLVYAFAGLDATSWTIKSLDPWRDTESGGIGNYRVMTGLREKYPDLTVSLAIGGWNEGSKNYSELAKYPERREKFVKSVVKFLREYGFNGFDLDWEFPADRGGDKSDKENFVSLVKELRGALGKKYHLSAAISANMQTIHNGYNITELSKYLDYIHVMSYDYHTSWERKVFPNTPLRSSDDLSVESTFKYLLNNGAPANKLVMGLAFYGRTFVLTESLTSPNESPIGRTCTPEGFKGPYTGQDGFMGYNEICEELVNHPNNWRIGWDNESSVPYTVNGDRVIIYDDPTSIKAKIDLSKDLDLGGVMVWSIDTDDFRGKCATLHKQNFNSASGTNFPLMRMIRDSFSKMPTTVRTTVPYNPKRNSAERSHFSYVLPLITLAAILYV